MKALGPDKRMHFCAACGRAMRRAYSGDAVVYRCACGREEKGRPEDARISGASFAAASATDAYRHLIRNAPFDRTNKLVRRDCAGCGLDYMSLVRLGPAEVVVYVCKCGRQDTPTPLPAERDSKGPSGPDQKDPGGPPARTGAGLEGAKEPRGAPSVQAPGAGGTLSVRPPEAGGTLSARPPEAGGTLSVRPPEAGGALSVRPPEADGALSVRRRGRKGAPPGGALGAAPAGHGSDSSRPQ